MCQVGWKSEPATAPWDSKGMTRPARFSPESPHLALPFLGLPMSPSSAIHSSISPLSSFPGHLWGWGVSITPSPPLLSLPACLDSGGVGTR